MRQRRTELVKASKHTSGKLSLWCELYKDSRRSPVCGVRG
ncbi:hypothetical protein VPHD518_0096 [Vibrio phage D518]